MRVRVCPAGFGCSQSSTRNCPPPRKHPDVGQDELRNEDRRPL